MNSPFKIPSSSSTRLGSQPAFKEDLKIENRFVIEGTEVWINPKNKFLVFQLHYSANPNKRDPRYRESIKSSMPRAQYMQEYELQWDSYSGLPVYGDFQESIHGSRQPLRPEIGLPLLRGWDFGLTPACVVAQLQGDSLKVLYEKTAQNMGITRFAELVMADLQVNFPEWSDEQRDWLDFADPSGVARKDTDEGTCFKILSNPSTFNLRVVGGAIDWESRRSSVEHYLLKSSRQGPGLEIDMGACPVLTRGFKGGYRYPEKASEVEPNKIRPLKDEHSHPHDALQMITSKLVKRTKQVHRNIPSPAYGFQHTVTKETIEI